jgi:Family of unknown function (DUF6461)
MLSLEQNGFSTGTRSGLRSALKHKPSLAWDARAIAAGPRASGPRWAGVTRVRGMLTMEVAAVTDREHEPATSDSGWALDGSEWDWVEEEYPNGGIRLVFVRGVTPERVIEAFGADPAAARLFSADVTHETLGHPWVRVGRTGEWAFAIDNWYELGIYDEFGQVTRELRDLSTGTELALLEESLSSGYFYYFVDGAEVTSFEPLLSAWRSGSDPDRFVPQMRQMGLNVDPPPDDAELQRDPTIALLDMLTLALGIRLSREVALGPLLTVQPGSAE